MDPPIKPLSATSPLIKGLGQRGLDAHETSPVPS